MEKAAAGEHRGAINFRGGKVVLDRAIFRGSKLKRWWGCGSDKSPDPDGYNFSFKKDF